MDDVNVGLLRPTNELCGLTLDDLATLYKKALREDLDCYFCLQNAGFVDEVYNWIVEAPRDEWVLRLAYVKVRFQRHGVWPNGWTELYEKIKLGRVDDHVAKEASGMVYMMRTFRREW